MRPFLPVRRVLSYCGGWMDTAPICSPLSYSFAMPISFITRAYLAS